MPKDIATPWGMSDGYEVIADGITFYTTPSHGGIHLSPERIAQLPKGLSNFLNNRAWWEEDVDWAVPYWWFRHDIRKAGKETHVEERIDIAKTIISVHEQYAHLLSI